ncbi:YlxR family protein [Deinococcus pimensis]|uniref:YlxR family protein n=1 Tax=Deinococcus pimensis TaxID=309888 RepID=UPI0004B74C55|nr:YlxR family protein [Deinococcus pimensis]
MTKHHVPERTCIACRRKRPQAELTRVTRTPQGWALVQGPRSGRGAYVCSDSPACWAEKRLRRALGASAPEVSERLTLALPAGEATHISNDPRSRRAIGGTNV